MTPHPSNRFKQAAQWLVPLLFFVLPFSIAAVEILFGLLAISWLFGWTPWKRGSDSIWKSDSGRPILLALLLYIGICALSVPWSTFPLLSLLGLVKKNLQFFLIFLIVGDATQEAKTARRCVWALCAAACLVILYALLQQWSITHFSPKGPAEHPLDPIRGRPLMYDRMVGPYSNPNDLATFLMVNASLLLAFMMKPGTRFQIGYWLLGGFALGCLAWTESKGAILGLVTGALALCFFRPKDKWGWLKIGGLIFAAMIFFLCRKKGLWLCLTLSDPSSKERMVMLNAAWHMIRERPILGLGINTFMANYMRYAVGAMQGPAYAHNCFLQITAETGVLGLTAFLWFLWKLFSSGWQALKTTSSPTETSKPILAGVLAGLMAFLVQSAFDTNLYSLRQAVLFWSLSGLAVSLSASAAQRPKS